VTVASRDALRVIPATGIGGVRRTERASPSRGRRVFLFSVNPTSLGDRTFDPFNYSVRRIEAAVRHGRRAPDAEVFLHDTSSTDVDAIMSEIERVGPDVLGASTYVWSFATIIEVARRTRELLPSCTIILGGPSARPAMFELEPFRAAADHVDALVLREGEDVFERIVAADDRSDGALAKLPGLAVPTPSGWAIQPTGALPELDALPSPFQHGLAPRGRTAHLETFRGCPLACQFCEWGAMDGASRIFSTEHLIRELEAFGRLEMNGGFLVDAALNLNSRAFHNLVAAERAVGFFASQPLSCEIYPSRIKAEHLELLARCRVHHVGIGVQSLNRAVLEGMQRPFDERRFEQSVIELADVAPCAAEIILGLPGDDPASFRETIERLRTLPCNIVVFHCLVLPDGLMTRATPEVRAHMRFDPFTLRMIECPGWTAEALEETRAWLDSIIAREGGRAGDDFWQFAGPKVASRGRRMAAPRS
jgi:radical SAM superfamily enzyme YgiQ (UPF0313 family)